VQRCLLPSLASAFARGSVLPDVPALLVAFAVEQQRSVARIALEVGTPGVRLGCGDTGCLPRVRQIQAFRSVRSVRTFHLAALRYDRQLPLHRLSMSIFVKHVSLTVGS
jgi:hypothetical protein